jgi:murein DD-endopeptidase MepM/ murein hydrolase activator NlpD
MQVLITHANTGRTRVWQLSRLSLAAWTLGLVALLMLASGTIYHFVFLKAAREGWPVVSQIVRLVVRDEIAQRDRFMRDNLDAMAQRLGELHAKMVRLETLGERLSGLAGVKVEQISPLPKPGAAPASGTKAAGSGQGGPFIAADSHAQQLHSLLAVLDESAEQHSDLFTLIESRLLESRLRALMVPNQRPVDGPVGSGFGFRFDPFTQRPALHAGLDFPAEPGTPIQAAAGGVVINVEVHAAYGNLVEIDHGNGLLTRYAHAQAVHVRPGDLVRRGQRIAEVGSTGRSTGPHLHFEVLVEGVPQDPARFLQGTASPVLR